MQGQDPSDAHEQTFRELREKLIRILGVQTVNRLIERAVLEIALVHPGLASLRVQGDDIELEAVHHDLAGRPESEIQAGYTALNGVLLLLVARLLGREIALRLTEGVSVSDLLESRVIGRE